MSLSKIIAPLRCPYVVSFGLLIVSVLALAMAYTAEYLFDLAPCQLCLYQRIPFYIVIALTLGGLLIKKKPLMLGVLILSGLAFLTNAGIAVYHTGVEQKWWVSEVEGCKVSFDGSESSTKDLLAQIMGSSAVPCDKIPWVDPVFGLSMANWNIPFCFGLAMIAFAGFFMARQSSVKDCPAHE